LAGTGVYYSGPPPRDEYILRFAGLGERALREAVRRLAARL
jgi:hypothetical protein